MIPLLATRAPQPSLVLDFLSGMLDSRIGFTRASTASYTDSGGTLRTAAIDTPRFDTDPATLLPRGLLAEEQRSNLLLYSAQFDNAAWAKGAVSVTPDTLAAPDGLLGMDALIENTAANAYHQVNQLVSKPATATTYSFTAYLSDKGRQVGIAIAGANTNAGVTMRVDPADGSIKAGAGIWGDFTAPSGSITPVGGGIYRVQVSATSNTDTAIKAQIVLFSAAAGSSIYTGDGVSGVYLWGAQLEVGGFATSYIPTTTAQATRTADIARITGADFAALYNPAACTVVTRFQSFGAANSFVLRVSDLTYSNGLSFGCNSGTVLAQAVVAGSPTLSPGGMPARTAAVTNLAGALASDDAQAAVNGTTVTRDTSGAMPPGMLQANLGSDHLGFNNLNGWIQRLALYPSRISDTMLRSLSA
jgi:hypothetical protein